MKQTFIGAICLSMAASIWGGMYVVSKYVLDFIPPFTLVWLRYVFAFVFLFIILKIVQVKQKKYVKIMKRDWLLFAWIGFIGYFLSIALQFLGTKLTSAHTGALITSATPAFMVIFAKIILKERITLRKVIAMTFATIGVFIVVGWDAQIGSYFWGSMILVGAAITWALLSVYVKVAAKRFPPLVITTYAIMFALLFTTPIFVWEIQFTPILHMDYYVALGVMYLSIIATAGAFFLWNKGLELMDAGVGSLFFFFQPIVGAFLGWLLLKEEMNSSFYVGGSFILFGVFIVTLQQKDFPSQIK